MELDRENIVRARRGDRTAQAAFIAMYQDRVHAVCVALAGPDADDCAQEALLSALLSLQRFDDRRPARLGTFVLRIARNRCIDRARSARVRTRIDVDVERLPALGAADTSLDAAREAELVRAAVLSLPDDQRAAIALRCWGELEYEEIAELLEIPLGTLRSRLSRAREALRTLLAPLTHVQGVAE